ncbi:MAG: hypothetical protein JSS12_06515 [Verrucomicrobia bacterium]|nr:hypothetical protein [Verrucomicrobiota bacterium]
MIVDYATKTVGNVVCGLPVACASLIKNSLYTLCGVGGAIVSVVSLGLIKRVNDETTWLLDHSKEIVTVPYKAVSRVINPYYEGHSDGTGIIAQTVATPFFRAAVAASYSNNFFSRHVVSRLSYAACGVLSIPTRVADFALGVILGAVAVVPFLARVERINTQALIHLSSTEVIADVCRCIRGVVNPNQFVVNLILSL